MKTIIYSIITIFIFGIVATSFTNQENTNANILIQTTDKNISSVLLTQSAKIISNRLKDFSSEKFEVIVIPEKNQIQVVLSNFSDLEAIENLLMQKGSLAFYETYNVESLAELLNGDNHLFSLMNSNANNLDVKIGCTSFTEIEKLMIANKIFFLSKSPSYKDWGVLKEKISPVNVIELKIYFKLHPMLNLICNARPLNPRMRDVFLKLIDENVK